MIDLGAQTPIPMRFFFFFFGVPNQSGNSDAWLLLNLLAQTGIGHRGFQGARCGCVCDGVAGVTELFVDTWVLGDIGGGGGVKDEAQHNDEERQQVQQGKL